MAFPVAGGAGELVIQTGIELGSDDNVDQVETGEVDDTFITIAPSFDFTGQTKFSDITANYRFESSKYSEQSNEIKHFLNANIYRPISERQSLSARASINSDSEDSTATDGTTVDNDYRDYGLGFTWRFGQSDGPRGISLLFDLAARDFEFSDIGDESNSQQIGAEYQWEIGAKTDSVIKAAYKNIDYKLDDFLTGAQTDISYGLVWQALNKTTGRAFIGQTWRDYDVAGRQSTDAWNLDFSLDWLPVEASAVTFNMSRGLRDAQRSDGFSAIRSFSLGAKWRHDLTDLLSFNADINRTEDDFVAPSSASDARLDTITTLSLGLSRAVSSRSRVSVTAKQERKDSSKAGSDYTQNLISARYDHTF